jgi:hypothetical protein
VRKLLVGGALLGVLAFAGTAGASDPITTPAPLSQEGCVSQAGDTCTYTATRDGGYAAGGSTWSLVVTTATATHTFGPGNAPPQGCALWAPGATVTVSGGASGGIAAGNPFPAPADGVNNDCAGGKLP